MPQIEVSACALLVDDMYGSDGQDTWTAMDVHPNIEVRLFAPYSRRQSKYLQFVTRFHDVNARMHTKTFTVDNQATIVGGRNIGDEYFDADPKLAFADNDILAVGPAVDAVSSNFDNYWNGDYSYPVAALLPGTVESDLQKLRDSAPTFMARDESKSYFKAVTDGQLANALRDNSVELEWGGGSIVHDAWWKRDQKREGWHDSLLITRLKPHLLGVSEELVMISPYFVPGKESVAELCDLVHKGVTVKILTNSLASNDVVAVHAGYTKYRKQLLRCGVELYELNEHLRVDERKSFTWLPEVSKSSLHAKTMIFDRKKMFVGSFNYDQRSLYLNTEIGLIFEQVDICKRAAARFDANIGKFAFKVEFANGEGRGDKLTWSGTEDGKTVSYRAEPNVGPGTKLATWFMRLLPVDWLL